MMTELGWNPSEFRMAPPGAPDEVMQNPEVQRVYMGIEA